MNTKIKRMFAAFLAVLMTVVIFATALPAFAGNVLIWPVPGHTRRSQGFHDGNAIDISDGGINGADVVAAMGGTVAKAFYCNSNHYGSYGDCSGFGTGIVINGDDGRTYQYAHMLGGSIPANVYVGARVSAGQKIGRVGNTGYSSGAHLHFGISIGNYWNQSGINPDNETYVNNIDTTPPNISSVEFETINAGSLGFVVVAKGVSDNVGLKSVRFAVWTDKNGQDDLKWYNASTGGNFWLYVPLGNHNNEYGTYTIHCYATDTSGNENVYGAKITINKQSLAYPTTRTIDNGTYILKNSSGMVLDVEGLKTDDGSAVMIHDINYGANQKFKFVYQGNGDYLIYPEHAGTKVLHTSNGQGLGWPLQIYAADYPKAQLFKVIPVGNGKFVLALSSKQNAVLGGKHCLAGGSYIYLQEYTNYSDASKWTFLNVNGTAVDPTHKHTFSSSYTVDVKPTCTAAGSESRRCTVCGEKTDVRPIEAAGHKYQWETLSGVSNLQWSEWTEDKSLADNPVYEVQTKTEKSNRTKSTTTSSSASLSGWTQYGKQVTSWGNWSAWQNGAVSSSASRQVETKSVPAQYKTVYCYYRYVINYSNGTKLASTDYVSGSVYDYIELDYPLTYLRQTDDGLVPVYGDYTAGAGGSYLRRCWFTSNPATKQVQTAPGYTQYRYRDGKYTYYFYKWSAWSPWSETDESKANGTTEVRSRTLYRYKLKDEYANGCKVQVCSACGARGEYAPIECSHSFGNGAVVSKATFAKDGTVKYTCVSCKKAAKTTAIPKVSTVKISATSFAYDGKVKTPKVAVKDSKGKALKAGTDYTLTYSNKSSKAIGKYTVKVTLKGKYSGTKTLTYSIVPAKIAKLTVKQSTSAVKVSWNAVNGAAGYRVFLYNTKTKKYVKLADTTKTSFTIKKLKAGTAYKVAVRPYGKSGKTVIWAAKYTAITTATKPTTPKLAVKAGAKKAVLKWNKQVCTGYQIYYSTKKNGTYKKLTTVKNAKTVSYTAKKLKTGSAVYFKVRAYRKVGSANVFGAFSAVKGVKIK